MSGDAVALRERVAEEYGRKARGAGCGDGGVAGLAGYRAEDLAGVPADAVATSFGCGDPVATAGIEPGDTVVDLGCGAGLDLVLAARRAGPTGRAIGIDMTRVMLERARATIARAGLANAEVREGIIEALPVESGSVQWVISNCVVNLSPEKPKVFAEVARVLAPGGRMLISDIAVDPGVPRWLRALGRRINPTAAAALGEQAYLDGLRAAGLGEVAIVGRLVYERESLRALLKDELLGERPGFLRRVAVGALAAIAARALAGKVASVRVFARRPL